MLLLMKLNGLKMPTVYDLSPHFFYLMCMCFKNREWKLFLALSVVPSFHHAVDVLRMYYAIAVPCTPQFIYSAYDIKRAGALQNS